MISSPKLSRRKLLYGYKATSDSYTEHLRGIGIEIGHGCEIFTLEVTHIEENNLHLITIGPHVSMTGPVTILCHDYSMGVTKCWEPW